MPNVALHSRDGDGDGNDGGLSTSTIVIIIVVCGCVLLLATVLFLWRFLHHLLLRKKPNPLPPVQLLAHQREMHTSLLGSKTFYANDTDSMLGLKINTALAHLPSDGCLTPSDSVYTSRPNSSQPGDAASSDIISALDQPLSATDAAPLPNNTYLVSTENLPPSLSTPISDASSIRSHITSGSGQPTTRVRARPLPCSTSRPLSMASSIATMQTFQSTQTRRSVIRGAPHSRHSNIQIVLPAPLAPESYPYDQLAMDLRNSRSSFFFSQDNASTRGSIFVDHSAPAGTHSIGTADATPGPDLESSFRYTPTRHAARSQSQSTQVPPNRIPYRRSQSQPRMDSSRLRARFTASQLFSEPPPVPQIPIEFANASRPCTEVDELRLGGQHMTSMPRAGSPPPSRHRGPEDAGRGRAHDVPLVHGLEETIAVGERDCHVPGVGGQRSRSRSRRNTLRKSRHDIDLPS